MKTINFDNKLVIIGFGSIVAAVLPLIFKCLKINSRQVIILTKDTEYAKVTEHYRIKIIYEELTQENHLIILSNHLSSGDFLLNLSVNVDSLDLIKLCQERSVFYLDTSIESWPRQLDDRRPFEPSSTNYFLREAVLNYRSTYPCQTTAVITHGANPGLVSHFTKQALLDIAKANSLNIPIPTCRTAWSDLAERLSVRVIHVAEFDSQISSYIKSHNEFINTWSVDGLIDEGSRAAELGWGTHEINFPVDAKIHTIGSKSAIYLQRPGASTQVKTWTPTAGSFNGYLITHMESISMADYFTKLKNNRVTYRPTVYYAYCPCELARGSLKELSLRNWKPQSSKRIALDEIVKGMDELGVLLMGNQQGAYWYGSQLSIEEARRLVPYNSATSLQVAVGVLSGMLWILENPTRGIVEPDEMDFQFIMSIAEPYLGKMHGEFTDWNPSYENPTIETTSPWQFKHFLVKD